LGGRASVVKPCCAPSAELGKVPHDNESPHLGQGPGAVPNQDVREERDDRPIGRGDLRSPLIAAGERFRPSFRPDPQGTRRDREGSRFALSHHAHARARPTVDDAQTDTHGPITHEPKRIAPRRGHARQRAGRRGAKRGKKIEKMSADGCRPRLRRRSILRLSGDGTPAPANDQTSVAIQLKKWCVEETEEWAAQAFLRRASWRYQWSVSNRTNSIVLPNGSIAKNRCRPGISPSSSRVVTRADSRRARRLSTSSTSKQG
jgi:hypothetical protein